MTAPTPPAPNVPTFTEPAAPPASTSPASPPVTPSEGQPTGQEPDSRPPWEREGTPFDPESAWKLIQNLRKDKGVEVSAPEREELERLRSQVQEAERAKMTETERVTADRDSFKTRAETAEQKLARYEIAAEKGLDPSAMEFLTGATKEELAASADKLKSLLGNGQQPAAPTTQRPAENLRVPPGGSNPAGQLSADDLDPDKLAALVPRGL